MAEVESAEAFAGKVWAKVEHGDNRDGVKLVESRDTAIREAAKLELLKEIALKIESLRETGSPLPMAIIAALNDARVKYSAPTGAE